MISKRLQLNGENGSSGGMVSSYLLIHIVWLSFNHCIYYFLEVDADSITEAEIKDEVKLSFDYTSHNMFTITLMYHKYLILLCATL